MFPYRPFINNGQPNTANVSNYRPLWNEASYSLNGPYESAEISASSNWHQEITNRQQFQTDQHREQSWGVANSVNSGDTVAISTNNLSNTHPQNTIAQHFPQPGRFSVPPPFPPRPFSMPPPAFCRLNESNFGNVRQPTRVPSLNVNLPPPVSNFNFSGNRLIGQEVNSQSILNTTPTFFSPASSKNVNYVHTAESSERLDKEQKQIDGDSGWVKRWIDERKPKISLSIKRMKQLSIPEIQQLLKLCLKFRDELVILQSECEKSQSAEQQSILLMKAYLIQKEIADKKKVLNNEVVTDILNKIKQQKCRQERKRKRKIALAQKRKEEEKERAEKHRKLDLWLQNLRDGEEEQKREKEMKAVADSVLAEVRRKLADATKGMETLSLLVKLRSIRKENADRKGIKVTCDDDENFELRHSDLVDMLQKQIDVYSREKRTLEVMLETEQEETKEKEQEERKRQLELKQQQVEEQIREYLFGERADDVIDMNDPMAPFVLYQEAASHSLDAFIEIRRQWDAFVVAENTADGSRIPPNWVIPSKPSSKVWLSALKEKQL